MKQKKGVVVVLNEIDIFLENLYKLDEEENERLSVRYIVNTFNTLLNKGNYSLCNQIFIAVDIDKLSSFAIIGFLSISRAARTHLASRADFLNRCRYRLENIRGKVITDKLLRDMG